MRFGGGGGEFASPRRARTARNTREKTLVKQHELLSEPPHDCPRAQIHTLVKRGRRFAWKLGVPELEELMRLTTNAPDEAISELGRRALQRARRP